MTLFEQFLMNGDRFIVEHTCYEEQQEIEKLYNMLTTDHISCYPRTEYDYRFAFGRFQRRAEGYGWYSRDLRSSSRYQEYTIYKASDLLIDADETNILCEGIDELI